MWALFKDGIQYTAKRETKTEVVNDAIAEGAADLSAADFIGQTSINATVALRQGYEIKELR